MRPNVLGFLKSSLALEFQRVAGLGRQASGRLCATLQSPCQPCRDMRPCLVAGCGGGGGAGSLHRSRRELPQEPLRPSVGDDAAENRLDEDPGRCILCGNLRCCHQEESGTRAAPPKPVAMFFEPANSQRCTARSSSEDAAEQWVGIPITLCRRVALTSKTHVKHAPGTDAADLLGRKKSRASRKNFLATSINEPLKCLDSRTSGALSGLSHRGQYIPNNNAKELSDANATQQSSKTKSSSLSQHWRKFRKVRSRKPFEKVFC